MPAHYARYEQFLRIFALLEILSTTRQPLDDQSLIIALKERLGLSRLSVRTLHRDAEFLITCGYPVEKLQLPSDRRFGWQLSKVEGSGRKLPAEPITLLELVAFAMARDLLRPFEGTVLWTGIESLRYKVERDVPPAMVKELSRATQVFHVVRNASRYAARPRLISTLSDAITTCRVLDIEERGDNQASPIRRRVQPHRLVIRPPVVELLAFFAGPDAGEERLLLDIARISKVTPRDETFVPRAVAADHLAE